MRRIMYIECKDGQLDGLAVIRPTYAFVIFWASGAYDDAGAKNRLRGSSKVERSASDREGAGSTPAPGSTPRKIHDKGR
jgi:hypothetical protein